MKNSFSDLKSLGPRGCVGSIPTPGTICTTEPFYAYLLHLKNQVREFDTWVSHPLFLKTGGEFLFTRLPIMRKSADAGTIHSGNIKPMLPILSTKGF